MSRSKPTKPVKTMSVSMSADLYDHLATERRRPKSWQMLEWIHAGMRSEGIQPADLVPSPATREATT